MVFRCWVGCSTLALLLAVEPWCSACVRERCPIDDCDGKCMHTRAKPLPARSAAASASRVRCASQIAIVEYGAALA